MMRRTSLSILALLLPLPGAASCESSPSNQMPQSNERSAELEAGDLVSELELTRISRSDSELAERAATIAGAVLGTNSCDAADASTWAQDAISTGFSAAFPFNCSSNIRVQYDKGRDVLIVENQALHKPLDEAEIVQRVASLGNQLGASVSKTQAVRAARTFLTAQSLDPVLFDSTHPWEVASIRGYVDGVSGPSAGTISTIRSYGVTFRRAFDEIYLLDTMLEVRVDGETGRITGAVIADVDLAVTGRQFTKMSSQTASDLMFDQLEDQAPSLGVDSFVLRSEQSAYVLPADAHTAEVFPVHHAVATPLTDAGTTGHTMPVAMPLVFTPGEDFTIEFLARRPASPPPQGPDGSLCQADSQCASGSCFVVEGTLGYCGDCASSSECNTGEGCLPPKVLNQAVRGSRCVPTARGVSCETDATCLAGDVCGLLDPAGASGVKTCGGCDVGSTACNSGTSCSLVLTPSQVAYRDCIAPASLGHVCDDDSGCASGRCVPISFASGREVGVCSECSADADCSAGETCSPPGITADVGFVGGACQ